MSGFRFRRAPDPSKPGTIYRSKPKVGRSRGLSSGPPYLDGTVREPANRSAPTPTTGVASVYREHGGTLDGEARNGQIYDDRGLDTPSGPANGFAGGAASGYRAGGQPPGRAGGPPGGPGGGPPGYPSARGPGSGDTLRDARRRLPKLRVPRLSLIVLVLVLVLIGYPVLLGLTAWQSLNRVDALAPAHKILDTKGTPGRTFLVVGSDSRSNLTAAERKRLGTGSAAGQRTDTIMLLHVPAGGGPTVLVSVPRDSYVSIPDRSKNKINAAYAFGGAPLLIRTLEQNTGLRIDEYVETGLGGFANIVDAIGGVTLCPKRNMNDRDAHINLKKGCQQMDGKTALGYARARHSDPRGDLGRVERQRETLAAIASKTLSPGTLLQPWRSFPAAKAGGGALTVDEGTSPLALTRFVLAMRAVSGGNGLSLTVPIGNPDLRTSAGSAVQWDRTQALALFNALKQDDTESIRAIADAQKKASG
jgi:LCP family protein required for cell wall assembly